MYFRLEWTLIYLLFYDVFLGFFNLLLSQMVSVEEKLIPLELLVGLLIVLRAILLLVGFILDLVSLLLKDLLSHLLVQLLSFSAQLRLESAMLEVILVGPFLELLLLLILYVLLGVELLRQLAIATLRHRRLKSTLQILSRVLGVRP